MLDALGLAIYFISVLTKTGLHVQALPSMIREVRITIATVTVKVQGYQLIKS